MKTTGLLLALSLVSAQRLTAQQVIPDSVFHRKASPALVKYGKWALLAAAAGMGVKAAHAHNDAERAFDQLQDYCDPTPTRCDQAENGDYLDNQAESIYQRSLSYDRHSRGWLLGGEVTFLGAMGLFVWELTRPKGPAKNIPFEPTVGVVGERTNLGVRVTF